jgi:hypothetical protein
MDDDGMATMATAFRQQRLASAMALVVVLAYAVLSALVIASGGVVAGLAVLAVGAAGGILFLAFAQMKAGVVEQEAARRAERSHARATRVFAELVESVEREGRNGTLERPNEAGEPEHDRPSPPVRLELPQESQPAVRATAG